MMNDEATESIQNVSKSIKYSSSSSHVNNLSMCKMNTDSIMIASKTLGLNISKLSVQCVVACSSSQKTMYQSSSRTKHNTSSIESIISKDVENVDGDAFVSFNLLCRQECERICKVLSSHKDLEPIRKMKKSYRVCDRMQIHLKEYSDEIFERLKPTLKSRNIYEITFPKTKGYAFEGTWRAVGLNTMWRFIRYRAGGHLAPHVDGSYVESSERRTMYTVNIYLNDVAEDCGGATVFCEQDQELKYETDEERYVVTNILASVRPISGSALIFQQAPAEILHAGNALKSGLKFMARSGIIYTRNPETRPRLTSKQQQGIDSLRKAKEAEAAGRFGVAMKFYSKAFKLWPALEEGDGKIAGI